ncbi:MAG: ComEC/Rec2 family competence protein [Candidatus Paceibacterota bacterium]|jgi:competence protein ComEC
MRSEYFFGFIISFIVGVALENIFNFGYAFALLCAFLSLILFLSSATVPPSKNVFLVSLVLLGCAAGILRVDVTHTNISPHLLDGLTEKTVSVSGIILDEPDVRETYTNISIYAENVIDGDKKVTLQDEAKILARVPVYPELKYGDEVTVTGKVTIPENFAPQDGAKAFDYRTYLAKDGIYYQMYFPKVAVVSHNKGNIIIEKLFTFKAWLMGNISKNIPEPESSLAGGITLGTKQSLGDEWLQKFRETGVAHIVVLSGYNIAVVAGIISRLVVFMPFTIRLVMSAIGIVLFAVMVGGGATVIRATVMALIIILARVLGREGDALRALVLAGGLMVFVNPMILLNDVSFQLSFSATIAIVTLVPVIEKYFAFIKYLVLREIVVTTIATQIFVAPLILFHMGSVSLIGLVSNIFILPLVPFAMLVVALVAMFGWVPLISGVTSFVAYKVLAYIFLGVNFFASIPFASLQGISFPLWTLALAYVILGYYIVENFPKKVLKQKVDDF